MKPGYLYATSTLLWATLVAAHFILHTRAVLSGPRNGDLYAFSWGFQGGAFLFTAFPFWLFAMGVILAFEIRYFHSAPSKTIQIHDR